jgi:hypothetical protein
MDALRTRGDCSPNELQRLNACRMHLRVSRLSEIASADGTSLDGTYEVFKAVSARTSIRSFWVSSTASADTIGTVDLMQCPHTC